jgi:hypothetical protein
MGLRGLKLSETSRGRRVRLPDYSHFGGILWLGIDIPTPGSTPAKIGLNSLNFPSVTTQITPSSLYILYGWAHIMLVEVFIAYYTFCLA